MARPVGLIHQFIRNEEHIYIPAWRSKMSKWLILSLVKNGLVMERWNLSHIQRTFTGILRQRYTSIALLCVVPLACQQRKPQVDRNLPSELKTPVPRTGFMNSENVSPGTRVPENRCSDTAG